MSYLISEILVCLLIAGLIGAILGWLFRGGCREESHYEDSRGYKSHDHKVASDKSEDGLKLKYSKNNASKEAIVNQEIDTIKDENKSSVSDMTVKAAGAGLATVAGVKAFSADAKDKVEDLKDSFSTKGSDKLNLLDESIEHEDLKDRVNELKDSISTNEQNIENITEKIDTKKESHHTDIDNNISNKLNISDERLSLLKEFGVDTEKVKFLEDNYDIQAIEGIGPKYAKLFKSMGIKTTNDLIEVLDQNRVKIDDMAKKLKVQPDAITAWTSMAKLIKLPGADGQNAEMLHTVGIGSLSELAITNPNSLHREMSEFNKKSPIVPEVPSLDMVTLWTKISKRLS